MSASTTLPCVVIVGLPRAVVAPIEKKYVGSINVVSLKVQRNGGHEFELNAGAAANVVLTSFDMVADGSQLFVIQLPYVKPADAVVDAVKVIEELGGKVMRPPSNSQGWPATAPVFDEKFLNELLAKVEELIDDAFAIAQVDDVVEADEADPEEAVISELLRGLASHTKMGPNNHSHEDDLWKSRGQGLKPNQRNRIVRKMLAAKLIDRKKNNSMGGTGWVYWIDDVPAVRTRFPELEGYFADFPRNDG